MKTAVIAIIVAALSASPAHAQDLAAGENSFKKCLACHAVGEGAKNKVGPLLNGLEGRKSGTDRGLQLFGGQQELRHHLEQGDVPRLHQGPAAKIPGTKMIFPGIKNETEANNLWAYLASFDASGKKK